MNLNNLLTDDELYLLANKAQCIIANECFWDYLQAVDGKFYSDDKIHLETLANTLENIYFRRLLDPDGNPYTKLMINMPPQHGKTRTLVHFCEWALGRNNEERIICASYNDSTASDFSRYVRDGITMTKIIEDDITFSDVFPDTTIKRGHGGFEKWALTGQHFNYLGAGIGGSITSKGATILLVDDPIKGAIEAYSANYLNKVWDWYTGTFVSRVSAEGGEPLEIIVMTRWAVDDLCGRLLLDKYNKDKWYVLMFEAYDETTDKMLCPTLLDKKRYDYLQTLQPRPIFLANYHQKPIQFEGALYGELKTYNDIPKDENGRSLFEGIHSYTDTADTGDDYLCTIIFGVYLGRAYILDVYYTKDKMEITEPGLAEKLEQYKSTNNLFESNNGGRGFSRNVARIYFERYKKRVPIRWFHQSKNKVARIVTNSALATEILLMPADWHNRWPEFFRDLMGYTKEGKNEHDDAPDAITGVVEMMHIDSIPDTFDNIL